MERYGPAAILIVLGLGGIVTTKGSVRVYTALGAVLGIAVLTTTPTETLRPVWLGTAVASIACELVALVLSIQRNRRKRHG